MKRNSPVRGTTGTRLSGQTIPIRFILRYPGIVNHDKADLREALKIFNENPLDFVDCILVAKSRSGELELISFDEKLQDLKRRIR